MRQRPGPVATLSALAFVLALTAPAPLAAAGGRPVIVELFTSQGCSSCPPADGLLTRLAAEAGARVVPLAFHVDYWDHLGWRDPFSSPDWSRRQQEYSGRLGSHLYTPQAVVDGRLEALGSDEDALRRAIAAEAGRPAATLTLDPRPLGGELVVDVGIELPPQLAGRELVLMLALRESGLTTRVARGENGGRSLAGDDVVRDLRRIAVVGPGEVPGGLEAKVPVAPEWSLERLDVVVFLQDPATLEIVGAAAAHSNQ